jgi:hypothetical protein
MHHIKISDVFVDRKFIVNLKDHDLYKLSMTEVRRGETGYLMHTFYDMEKNDDPKLIWHIHGEINKPDSIILGHYGYFKLIVKILEKPKKDAKCLDNDDLGKPKS